MGRLVLVGTPLGNRGDLAPRAREAIVAADLLLCEDTRSPVRLLGDEGELPPRVSCFVGNEHERIELMLRHLERGDTVAYVSEAGLPVWSDPGRLLVAAAIEAGYEVDVVPGPVAAAVAVCHSGYDAAQVRFVGFLPRAGPARRAALDQIAADPAVTVLYEAGNRVPALLRDLADVLDGSHRSVTLARELTKLHQEILRGTVAELHDRVDRPLRGEVTVVVSGRTAPSPSVDQGQRAAQATLEAIFAADLKPREKARRLASLTGLPSDELYQRLFVRDRSEGE